LRLRLLGGEVEPLQWSGEANVQAVLFPYREKIVSPTKRFLVSVGLGDLVDLFEKEKVDVDDLKELDESSLKDLCDKLKLVVGQQLKLNRGLAAQSSLSFGFPFKGESLAYIFLLEASSSSSSTSSSSSSYSAPYAVPAPAVQAAPYAVPVLAVQPAVPLQVQLTGYPLADDHVQYRAYDPPRTFLAHFF